MSKKSFIGYYCECASEGGCWSGAWQKVGRYKSKENAFEGVKSYVEGLRDSGTAVRIRITQIEEKEVYEKYHDVNPFTNRLH